LSKSGAVDQNFTTASEKAYSERATSEGMPPQATATEVFQYYNEKF
jgi:hypothetical protein